MILITIGNYRLKHKHNNYIEAIMIIKMAGIHGIHKHSTIREELKSINCTLSYKTIHKLCIIKNYNR